ncbi:MAG TPA: thiamine phosphate synthase, partial [Geminicoccaceae bacterium]
MSASEDHRDGEGEPSPSSAGLLLWAPAAPGPGFAAELAGVLATGTVAAVVAPAVADEGVDWRPARQACHEAGVAFLVGDDLDRARGPLAADGVHLLEAARVPGARGLLGADALIGASCGRSRHDAMVAGEDGADYVTFAGDAETVAELCAWWAELFTLPCAADLRGTDGAGLAGMVVAGADFLALDETAVWSHPDGAAVACEE